MWKSGIDWKSYSAEVLSGIIGGWLFVQTNGWVAVVANIGDFLLSILAFPFTLALLYSVYKLIITPVEIYRHHIYQLEKYDWSRVEIEPVPFDILGLDGWGVKVTNNKHIPLEEVSIWLHGVREGQDWQILNNKEIFGYLNERAEILSFDVSKVLDTSKSETFAITTRESGFPVFFVRTDKRRELTNSHIPLAIDINIKAKTENYELPPKLIRLNVYSDGKISIRK
ncbi:MAG TPA: hypothetical protein DHW49_03945, partial [Anaerolineae bacterium]|nr:hypothetical protein [Anaerolineae bacterium]